MNTLVSPDITVEKLVAGNIDPDRYNVRREGRVLGAGIQLVRQ